MLHYDLSFVHPKIWKHANVVQLTQKLSYWQINVTNKVYESTKPIISYDELLIYVDWQQSNTACISQITDLGDLNIAYDMKKHTRVSHVWLWMMLSYIYLPMYVVAKFLSKWMLIFYMCTSDLARSAMPFEIQFISSTTSWGKKIKKAWWPIE